LTDENLALMCLATLKVRKKKFATESDKYKGPANAHVTIVGVQRI